MNGGHASSSVISSLKRAGVIKRYVSPQDAAAKADKELNASRKRADKTFERDRRSREKLESAYRKAVDEFSKQFRDFTLESPEISPEDAAPDLAENFFHEYPDWPKWAAALRMSRIHMKEAITDYVYEAMMKGAGKEME
jgi:hypothetical protein